jgi:hypothetical protein
MSGCLGMNVTTGAIPSAEPKLQMDLTLLWGLKESNIDATECRNGISNLRTVWPIWGGAVAWLTFLLVVPTYTAFECAAE